MSELKPCPFCGETPVIIKTTCLSNGVELYHAFHNCFAINEYINSGNFETEKKAVKVWNARTVDAVEVVRCGECKNINKFPCPARDCNTGNTKNCIGYCSMGERKESEGE